MVLIIHTAYTRLPKWEGLCSLHCEPSEHSSENLWQSQQTHGKLADCTDVIFILHSFAHKLQNRHYMGLVLIWQNCTFLCKKYPVWPQIRCVSREQVQLVIVAATVRTTIMRITLETAFLWKTVPVCTAGKCLVLDRVSKATAKPGSFIISLSVKRRHTMTCTPAFQCLWSGPVELQRPALFWEVSSLWKWTLPDLWLQLVPI